MMPPADGFAILESLRADAGDTFLPVVILTADTNEETKRRVREAGATDFLLKPFDHVEVALRIRNLLKGRRAAPASRQPARRSRRCRSRSHR